jgi:hypothetical protein
MATVDFGTILHSFQTSAGLSEQIIIVNNAQPIATPSPFQLQIQLNPSTFKFQSALASDLGNIRFYTDSLLVEPLLSWVESGTSTSTSATIWVVLPNGLGANSSMILYMVITPNQEFDGVYAGQAPQLSSIYAQYDNGASVFPFYENFAGTSLNAKWTAFGTLTSTVVSNGLSLTGVSSKGGGYYAQFNNLPSGQFLESLVERTSGTTVLHLGFSQSTTEQLTNGFLENGYSSAIGNATSTSNIDMITTAVTILASGTYTPSGLQLVSFGWNVVNAQTLNLPSISSTDTSFTSSSYLYMGVFNPVTWFLQWIRVRSYPPNGVMPALTFL